MEEDQKARDVEAYMALRLSEMRQAAGWSFTKLAEKMENAGCPIDRSSLQKIENGKPRRKITVNELVAFSMVFDAPIATFLDIENDDEQDWLMRALEQSERLASIAIQARKDYSASVERLKEIVDSDPKFKARMQERFAKNLYAEIPFFELFTDDAFIEATVSGNALLTTAYDVLGGETGPLDDHPLKRKIDRSENGE